MPMYRVTLPDMHIAKNRARLCYAYMKTPGLKNFSVSIISKDAQARLRPGYMESEHMYAATYTEENVPETFDDFWNIYRKNRVGITCMASFDDAYTIKVGMTLMPETYDINLAPENQIVIATYSPEADEYMDSFLRYLYETYASLL
ncbi:MAG: hypothetical protein Q4C42_04145 [Clostridia bacterium]|nr:hypothetical protein [Clostridia bacterium]